MKHPAQSLCMILGITGPIAAGKGEVVAYLEKKGFQKYSLSDVVREEARKRGQGVERPILQKLGNELREKHGPAVLAKITLEKIKENNHKDVTIDSVRNPYEVELLKESGAVIIGVNADKKIRFERMRSRGRVGDAHTFEEFLQAEEIENRKQETGQQLQACYDMAEYFLQNDKDLEELHTQIEKLLVKLKWK